MSHLGKSLIFGAVLGSAMAVAVTAQSAEYKWRMATAVAENSYFYNDFVKRFADEAKTLTNGREEITPYGAGVIAPAFKVYDAVSDGLVETGHSSPGYLTNKDPVNALMAAFAGGMSAEAALHWLYFGGGREMWIKFREQEMELHPLIVGMHGSEIYAHSRKPIRVAADLKGLKFRTAGSNAWILKEKFGANPVSAAQAEIYGLLERGAIDAAEFATPGANVSDGYYEVAKYVIVPGIHTPNSVWEAVIKKDRWDALPADIKTELEEAARLTTIDSLLQCGVDDLAAIQKFRDHGNEIVQMDPSLVQKYREYGREWGQTMAAQQKAKGNLWMEKFLKSYTEFQDTWAKNAVYRVKDE